MFRFIIIFVLLFSLQYLGGGIPKENDIYFYLGYFSVPLLLAFSITFLLDLLTINKDKNTNEKGFFDLPLGVILQNIASAILLTLQDITSMKSFTDINLIKNIFLKENRILYIGIFISVLAVFIFLFFG